MLLSLFAWGLVHGVGPDHCLAIGALAARGGPREAVGLSLRFGAGHALVLAVCALGASALGVVIPARWEAALELVGGVALIALGAWTVGAARDVDTDAHAFQGRRPGEHRHGGHRHGPGPVADVGGLAAIAGAVFGLSGVRGLVLLLPVALQGRVALTALAVVLFGAGVMASMLAVGSLAQLVASRARRVEQALHLGVGVLSVVVGSYWVVDHLGS